MIESHDKKQMNRPFHSTVRFLIIMICTLMLSFTVFQTKSFAESPSDIAAKIEQLRSDSLQAKLNKAGFSSVPKYINIRIYKADAELEVWAGNNDKDPMKLLAAYPVCAMGFQPGTKLKEGDERTPEGSFGVKFLQNSKQWYMHINLSEDHLDDEGNVKNDPSFYACTDYPTKFDKALSASVGVKNPGSAICLHGNCVSVGCASMENHDFVEIYYWMAQHDTKKYGELRTHILPFRFYEKCNLGLGHCFTTNYTYINRVAEIVVDKTPQLTKLGKDKILALWQHIAGREKQFISNPTPANAELEMSMDILKDKNKEKKK